MLLCLPTTGAKKAEEEEEEEEDHDELNWEGLHLRLAVSPWMIPSHQSRRALILDDLEEWEVTLPLLQSVGFQRKLWLF